MGKLDAFILLLPYEFMKSIDKIRGGNEGEYFRHTIVLVLM